MLRCQEMIDAQTVIAKTIVGLFIGMFLLACQPKAGGFIAPHLTDRESKLVNVGDFLDGVIAGRSFKGGDFQTEFRLGVGTAEDDPDSERVFVRAIDQTSLHYDDPTAGSFLIRSPPSHPVA